MIKEIKKKRLEAKFINYINETIATQDGGKTLLYSHGTRFVFWSSNSTRTLKVYLDNIMETFKGQLPDNYKEIIDNKINPRKYAIIVHGENVPRER